MATGMEIHQFTTSDEAKAGFGTLAALASRLFGDLGGKAPFQVGEVCVSSAPCALSIGLYGSVPAMLIGGDASLAKAFEGHVRHALDAVVSRFLRDPVIQNPGLVRPPGLHIVFVFDFDSLDVDHQLQGLMHAVVGGQVEELERRVGLTLPDFRVDLVKKEGEKRLVDLEPVHNFHLQFMRHQDATGVVDTASLARVANVLRASAKALSDLLAEFQSENWVERALVGWRILDFTRHISMKRLVLETTSPSASPTVQLLERVTVRGRPRWAGELELPISPMTFVAAGNGAGKTSLAESLCWGVTGVSRVRLDAPPHADDGFESVAVHWTESSEAPSGLSGKDLFPVFSDDAALSLGRNTPAVLARFWASAGRDSDFVEAVGALRTRWRMLLGEIERCSDQPLVPANAAAIGSQWVTVPAEWGSWVAKNFGYRISGNFGLRDGVNAERGPIWALPGEEEEEDFRFFLLLGDRVAQVERPSLIRVGDVAVESGTVVEVPSEALPSESSDWWHVVESQPEEINQWLEYARVGIRRVPANLSETRWRALLSAVKKSGPGRLSSGLTLLAGFRAHHRSLDRELRQSLEKARLSLLEWPTRFEQAMADALDAFQPDSKGLEGDLDRYLNHRTRWWSTAPLQRLNTATLLRQDIAARLAAMLNPRGMRPPILVLDEPALAQQTEAATRTLARICRLARAHEGQMWSDDQAFSREMVGLRGQMLERTPNDPVKSQQVRPADWHYWPGLLPPTLILLSYSLATLQAVADIEGHPVNHSLRQTLSNLVPDQWLGILREVFQQVAAKEGSNPRSSWVDFLRPVMTELRSPDCRFTFPKVKGEVKEDAPAVAPPGWAAWAKNAKSAADKLGIQGLWWDPSTGKRLVNEDEKKETFTFAPGLEDLPKRVLLWMAMNGLLTSIFSDEELHLAAPTLSLRRLKLGSEVIPEYGVSRLRRVSCAMLRLPTLPQVVAVTTASAGPIEAEPAAPKAPAMVATTNPRKAPKAGNSRDDATSVAPERAIQISPRPIRGPLHRQREEADRAFVRELLLRLKSEAAEDGVDWRVRLGLGLVGGGRSWTGGLTDYLVEASEDEVQSRFGGDLDRLIETFVDLGSPHIRVALRVTPATALRAGWVFRQANHYPVSVMGGPPSGSETEWSFKTTEPPMIEPAVTIEGPDDHRELHLVALTTPNAREAVYRRWRAGNPGNEVRLVIMKEEMAVNTATQMNSMAAMLHRLMQKHMPTAGSNTRTRLFLSGPVTVCFALGRLINASGTVDLMDHDRDSDSYLRRFTLQT